MYFKIPENQRSIRISLKKREMIDLIKACTLIQFSECFPEETRKTYRDLHDKIQGQIRKWEEQNNDNK